MNSRQAFYALLAAVSVLALGILGVGYGANAILTSQSAKLSQSKAESQAAERLQQKLRKDKEDLVAYSYLNDTAKAIVPQDKSQAQTVREIVELAKASGINTLTSVTFPASTLGAVGATGTAGAAGSSGSVSRPSSKLTQVTPVPGLPNVYLLPITVTQDAASAVSYDTFIEFLRNLEQNRRTAQINSITIQPDAKNPDRISFSFIINGYVKP